MDRPIAYDRRVSNQHEADDARLSQLHPRPLRDSACVAIDDERRDIARLLVADVEELSGGFEVHLPRSLTPRLHRAQKRHPTCGFVNAQDGDAVVPAVLRVYESAVGMYLDVRRRDARAGITLGNRCNRLNGARLARL